MEKAKFIRTEELTAIRFDPDEHPWHHSIQRKTIDGKILPDHEGYFCIIPCSSIDSIRPGDWIIVDNMNNARGVLREQDFSMLGIRRVE